MKKTAAERAVLWVGIPLVIAWTFLPIVAMVWASLMPFNALINGGLLQWPSGMGFANYRAVLGIATINQIFGGQPMAVARGFINSAVVAVLVATIATAISVVGGYAFGRFRFPFQNTLLFVLLSVRVLPPIAVTRLLKLVCRLLSVGSDVADVAVVDEESLASDAASWSTRLCIWPPPP